MLCDCVHAYVCVHACTGLYAYVCDEKVNAVPKYFAAIGFNVETVQYKNLKFQVWDLGGQTSIRSVTQQLFKYTKLYTLELYLVFLFNCFYLYISQSIVFEVNFKLNETVLFNCGVICPNIAQ